MDQNIEELVADGIIVQPYYMMDPETEVLVRSTALRNGMMVLIESPTIKSDLTQASMYDDAGYRQMLAYNRWCTVSDLIFDRKGMVSFIGTYYDGTMITINVGAAHNWYAKKDSIPEQSLLEHFGVMLPVVFSGNPEADSDAIIEAMRKAGFPFDDKKNSEDTEPTNDHMGGPGSSWVRDQQTDPNNELGEFDAGVASKDPSWVQQLEGKWNEEKGTTTKKEPQIMVPVVDLKNRDK